jgi:death-on-curing protein
MKEPAWVLENVAQAVHSMLLASHGGGSGIREKALLDSELARPRQKYTYEPNISIFVLAAAYSFGIAKNHLFVDGSKRTAFTIGTLFLEINGFHLGAPEPDAAITFEKLASGQLDEAELAGWFETHCSEA